MGNRLVGLQRRAVMTQIFTWQSLAIYAASLNKKAG